MIPKNIKSLFQSSIYPLNTLASCKRYFAESCFICFHLSIRASSESGTLTILLCKKSHIYLLKYLIWTYIFSDIFRNCTRIYHFCSLWIPVCITIIIINNNNKIVINLILILSELHSILLWWLTICKYSYWHLKNKLLTE